MRFLGWDVHGLGRGGRHLIRAMMAVLALLLEDYLVVALALLVLAAD